MLNNGQQLVRDPVCHMDVESGNLDYEYLGLSYSFCSEQCKGRFKSNPHLYIGQPGKQAPKQQGKTVIRKRVLKLDMPVPADISPEIKGVLEKMMGIKSVEVDNNIITIIYDLLEATMQQIEAAIELSGKGLSPTWTDRIKRAFIHYIEDTELDNLEHQHDAHGCHHDK